MIKTQGGPIIVIRQSVLNLNRNAGTATSKK